MNRQEVIVNKQQAIEAGLLKYNGSPCKYCGRTERYVKWSKCVSCSKQRVREKEKPGGERYKYKLDRNYKAKITRKGRVFDHYGRVCTLCGFDDMRALTIDHINQRGNEHVNANGRRYRAARLYSWLCARDFPTGFRTLCRNCQAIAHAEFDGKDEDGNGGSQFNLLRSHLRRQK